MFLLTTTNYFDNSPCVTIEEDTASARRTFVAVMDLLGWQLKEVEEVVFASRLGTLGVSFEFERAMESRQFDVDNKPGRIEKIRAQLMELIAAEATWPGAIRSLVGTLRYARPQLFGRCGALALKCLVD